MDHAEQPMTANQATPVTFEVRPGVAMPDWTVVSSLRAGQALTDIITAFGIEKLFDQYDAQADRVRVGILRFFRDHGRPPTIDEIGAALDLPKHSVTESLRRLKQKDLVVFEETEQKIIGAYPFTERETGHQVEIGGRYVNAMCAVDALGAGSMFNTDALVRSSCRATGTPITIELRADGTDIAAANPETAIVWSGIQLSDGCAADSLCTVIAFFASDAAFETWRATEHPDTPGYRLSLDEGLQVGRAIFDPVFAGIDRPSRPSRALDRR